MAQLKANMQALDVALDEEAKAALNAMAEPADVYWATRKGLAWRIRTTNLREA